MYKRQSVYRNPQESVSSNALAAASTLGKAMSPNGREVDHSKIPFYNAPSKIASMTNLSRTSSMTKKSSPSPGRRSSMYVSSTTTESKEQNKQKKRIIVRSPSLQQKHNSISRRASSLPSDRHHSITSNKSMERDAQHTFQEFGGPQSMSPNSFNSQPIRTMKKYIPGPHGLIAVEVPIDDDMKRRQRGSYSLTSNHHYLKRSSSVNQHLRNRVSSDNLNRGSQRTSSIHNSSSHKPSTNTTTNTTTTTTTTITKRRIPSSTNSNNKTNIPKSKSHQNVTSKQTKKSPQPTRIHRETKPESTTHVARSLPSATTTTTTHRALHKPPREPVPMIESSMPEETELELENEQLVTEQETSSKIELNELLEENIELAEQLHNNVSIASSIGQESHQEPEHNQTFDSIIVTPPVHTESDHTTDSFVKDNDDKSESSVQPYESKESDEERLLEKETLGTHVNKILQVENENFARANRSVTSSFYDDDEGVGNDSFNTDVSHVSELEYDDHQDNDVDRTEEQIQPIVLSDKSFASNNENTTVEDVIPKNNETGDYGETEDKEGKEDKMESVENILENHLEKLTPEMEKKEMEALGLQLVDNPYLNDEGDDSQLEEIRDGSSDYVTTEEDHVKTPEEPTHPIPPPMSPKRHREGVHPVNNNTHDKEQGLATISKNTVDSIDKPQHITSPKNTDSTSSHVNSRITMADYLRSANPYLNKKDEKPQKPPSKQTTKIVQSTPAKKKTTSPVKKTNPIKSPIKSPTKIVASHQDLKPPLKLSQGGTPIKSALKKTRSNSSGNSPYDHTSTNSAYLSLTTAENTRLNAQMSMENLVPRKGSIKKFKRPQSMVTQPTQRTSAPVAKEIKKKPAAAPVERKPSTLRNSRTENKASPARRQSKIERSRPAQNRESLIENTAKQMAQDSRMSSILYPVEQIPKKSSFEKLRPEADHMGFKSLSLRGGITNEIEYEQNSMSNKFRQSEAAPSYPINQQQRTQQMQPLTASMGPGSGTAGWTSRFQDSDSDDDFFPPSNNNGGGRGISGSMNGASPSKSKGNGFSLFRSKKHYDSQENPQQQQYQQSQQYAPVSSPLGTKFSKTSLRTASAVEQSPLHAKSGLGSQQRIHSDPQPASAYRSGSNNNGDGDDHKKSNKFGTKLKKIFGRKK